MIVERYEELGKSIRRTVTVDGRAFHSSMEDVSGLASNSSAWAKWWRSYLLGAQAQSDGVASATVTIGDLFCGCGGLTLGAIEAARALGFSVRIRFGVDMDSQALAVYSHNFAPEWTLQADVSTLVGYQLRGWGERASFAYPPELLHRRLMSAVETVDLLLAGPPCEGHSNLNNRTRRKDPRNILYLDAVAIAVALRAKAIVLENVPEIVHDRTSLFETAVSTLKAAGYFVTWGIIAADKLGWPQTRRRLFLVASRLDIVNIDKVAKALVRKPMGIRWAIEDLADKDGSSFMDSVSKISPENRRRIDYLFENDLYDLPQHERPSCHRNGHTYPSVYGRLRWDEPSGTITTGFMSPGRGRFIHPARKRTLTPHEAARLQGFPDWFDFSPGPGIVPSKSDLSKWIGDAVPTILGYAAVLSALSGFVQKDRQ